MKIINLFTALIIFTHFFMFCKGKISVPESDFPNVLNNLQIQYIDGIAYSNLMPEVPPDPVYIKFRLEFHNLSLSATATGLRIKDCKVFLMSDSLLGEIEMNPTESISILPSSIDTVSFVKVQKFQSIFDSPCDSLVYLSFDIRDNYNNRKKFQTNLIPYGCMH